MTKSRSNMCAAIMLCMLCAAARACGPLELFQGRAAGDAAGSGGERGLASACHHCNRAHSACASREPSRPVAGHLRSHDVGRHR